MNIVETNTTLKKHADEVGGHVYVVTAPDVTYLLVNGTFIEMTLVLKSLESLVDRARKYGEPGAWRFTTSSPQEAKTLFVLMPLLKLGLIASRYKAPVDLMRNATFIPNRHDWVDTVRTLQHHLYLLNKRRSELGHITHIMSENPKLRGGIPLTPLDLGISVAVGDFILAVYGPRT